MCKQRRWTLLAGVTALVLVSACGQLTVPEPGTLTDPRTTAPAASPTVRLDFGKLERRPAPVAYWSVRDQAIHDDIAGTVVPYRTEPLFLGTLTRARVPRYAVIPEIDGAQVQLIGADGTTRDLGRGYESANYLTVSPDRRKVGWYAIPPDDEGDYRLIVAEVPSGRVLVERMLGEEGSVGPFLSNDLIEVTTEAGSSGDLGIVRVSDRKDYPVNAPEVLAGAPDAHLLLMVAPPEGVDGLCHGVFQLGKLAVPSRLSELGLPVSAQPEWQSCEIVGKSVWLRPDGRYLALAELQGSDPARYTVIDLEDSRRALEVRADQLGVLAWSDDGDQFVVEAVVGDRFALVTCDLAGELRGSCGLSTDPVQSAHRISWRRGPAPYVLAGDG